MRSTTSAPGFKAFATSARAVAELDEAIVLAFLDGIAACEGGRAIPSIHKLAVVVFIELIPDRAIMVQSCGTGLSQWNHCVSHQSPLDQAIRSDGGQAIPFCHFCKAEQWMAVRSAHHALSLGHSDDAHAHLGGVIRNIPKPLLGQVRDTHMLIIILKVAILGADVVSELPIKIIVQLHASHSKQ